MKSKITLFALMLTVGSLAACSGDHRATSGKPDTVGQNTGGPKATNPYRDTFKTTTTTGDATTLDNGGNGGTMIAKPIISASSTVKPAMMPADTAKK
jgi:hypothetical protein